MEMKTVQDMSEPENSHLLVAAFDFGTTYSGYAFSFRNDPLKVQTNQSWVAGSEQLISLKTPTCVLFDPDRNFHSFGFQAENKYADLALEDKHHDWMFFRRFKMLLHNNEKLSRQATLEDINGKKMEAMTIFSMSIKYLQCHLLEALSKQVTGAEEADILYVLTVPAIWDDSAKQFMREAAIKAGIDDARLKLALEPEAASIWCQVVTDEAKAALAGSGTKYMVVDLGGGTADITVHEKLSGGNLQELHKASGGPWGGMYVDNNYLAWLEKLFGKTAMDRFKKEDMADYFDLIREFETKKRSITATSTDLVTFRISAPLREKSETNAKDVGTLERRLKNLNLADSVSIVRDKMRVHPDIVREWFREPVDNVLSHVKKILEEPRMLEFNTILLVGGFGESRYVQEAFRTSFKSQRLIVPAESGLVVLKGAVRFGHAPFIIASRIMQYTYGVSGYENFDESRHTTVTRVVYGGTTFAKDVFFSFVKIGDKIFTGTEVIGTGYQPAKMEDKECVMKIFRSTDPSPTYTTEASCKMIGEIVVEFPDGKTLEEKKVDVVFVFGETEIIVKAKILKTGREFYTKINCLE